MPNANAEEADTQGVIFSMPTCLGEGARPVVRCSGAWRFPGGPQPARSWREPKKRVHTEATLPTKTKPSLIGKLL